MRGSQGQPVIYALRGALVYSTPITLVALSGEVMIPAGLVLIGMIGTGANFVASTKVQLSHDGGTTWTCPTLIAGACLLDGGVQSIVNLFPFGILCDGITVKIVNTGGGDVTDFSYITIEDKAQ